VENGAILKIYAVEYTRILANQAERILFPHRKMIFSVEKYVGNVDNFLAVPPVENLKILKMRQIFYCRS